MLPGEDPAEDEYYLRERYLGDAASQPPSLYYKVKPLVPRRAQMALRRARVRRAGLTFPAWPFEEQLVRDRAERLRTALAERGEDREPFVNYWPRRHRFAVVLTHDVEGTDGVRNIPEVLEVERRQGFVSSWNFCAESYAFDRSVFDFIRAAGCEIGLHGIHHDSSLFSSRSSFVGQLPKIRRYLDDWGAVGFRSPSTIRNANWMHELPCLYDSSFPQNDPYQPQPGGCCSPFPFFFGDVVELPITLDQDHTLFEFLRSESIDLWVSKTEWLVTHHGLVNLIVHPDYMTKRRLALYERFLAFLRGLSGGWHALPADVARWWQARSGVACTVNGGEIAIAGELLGATVAWARPEAGRLVYET